MNVNVHWNKSVPHFFLKCPYMTSYPTSIDTFSLSQTVFEIFDFKVFRDWPWSCRGHLRSKIFPPFESPYMNFYLTSIDTFSLSCPVFEIFDFKSFCLNVNVNVHWNKSVPHFFRKPIYDFLSSYPTSIDTFSLSQTVFEIFDFKVFRDWPWSLEVTWGQKYFHHSKAHKWIPI